MISIYILVDPRDGRVRYVGQTRDPERRAAAHYSASPAITRPAKRRWIMDVRKAGMRPRMIVIGHVDERHAFAMERLVINFFASAGERLLNGPPPEGGRRTKITDEQAEHAVRLAGGDKAAAARALGVSVATIYDRLRRIESIRLQGLAK